MWPGVRPAVFGEISSGKKYGGKTPVVRVPVARCPAVNPYQKIYIGSWEKSNLKTSCCLREQFDNGGPCERQIEAGPGSVSRQRAPRVKYGGLMRKLISA